MLGNAIRWLEITSPNASNHYNPYNYYSWGLAKQDFFILSFFCLFSNPFFSLICIDFYLKRQIEKTLSDLFWEDIQAMDQHFLLPCVVCMDGELVLLLVRTFSRTNLIHLGFSGTINSAYFNCSWEVKDFTVLLYMNLLIMPLG